jgi:hypothetical protein
MWHLEAQWRMQSMYAVLWILVARVNSVQHCPVAFTNHGIIALGGDGKEMQLTKVEVLRFQTLQVT